MVTKYFVEVIASNKQLLINLQKFELDLFQSTAKSINDDKEFKIDGLISLDDINNLVEKGYKVVIKSESMKKTPAVQQTTSFQEWSKTAKKTREVATKGVRRGGEEGVEGELSAESLFTLSFTGYLTSEGIDSALQYIAKSYPSLVQLIVLPEKTHEGRTSRAIKIGTNNSSHKSGLLFLGGGTCS